ncbi:glycosyltransferase [Neptunomonas japonica]|uniref:Glycosyl transferase family 1 n=1 Tax=Neptunomonas japonica JAMM 1380 TaxID=1441457 RepID=A0A7R6PHL8_9GAMM|nr:glycosyltransferase [Neptunomonas japonica]BBB29783.1 glycosyl transferase family 1 [Neptunomonas japonica JAMM 1380]
MIIESDFHSRLHSDYDAFLNEQKLRFPSNETLKIDIHCHDKNSDVPDELWGRLLRLPETWLKTKDLVKTLERNGTDLITVTNHNNARSCWQLLDMGYDVLVGAEFTCHFPDSQLSIHVLTYGFTPSQERDLNNLRHNILDFTRYTLENDIPTVLPHPLFFYTHKQRPDISILEKFAVMFQRFEVLNGQRGYWQNQLTRHWVESLTPDKINAYAHKHNLNPYDFCTDPYNKSFTGGSDDHNGIFAGRTGTLAHIPDLENRLKNTRRSELVLEAIRDGNTAPYGEVGKEEKLTVTFLDYFSQVAIHMEDPGLLRLLLHKGSLQDKMLCLGVSNAMQELKRHKYTLTFLKTFHEALSGTKPALLTSIGVSKEFRPTLKVVKEIARTQRKDPDNFLNIIRTAIPEIYNLVTSIFFSRLNQHLTLAKKDNQAGFNNFELNTDELIRKFEIPTQLRALFAGDKTPELTANSDHMTSLNLTKMLDQLTFPALASLVIAGASFAASQVIYSNRPFLNELADHLDKGQHPQKILWLTDTFSDHNGVSSALQSTLSEIQKYNYPIDILTCHPTLKSEEHLVVVEPVHQFKISSLGEQEFNVPDMIKIQRIFEQGSYDRIICSTEMLMGAIALYLKKAFSVPAFFFMHTDWMEFVQQTMNLNGHEKDRIRRLLRAFYLQFEGIYTLNNDHRDWLTSPEMGIDTEKVFLTQHWVADNYRKQPSQCDKENRCSNNTPHNSQPNPIFLYVGRLSDEKGVFDLPSIYSAVKSKIPHAELWVAGTGPAAKQLQIVLPEATFLGWVDKADLPALYQRADLLLLPSRFDTFGCVVLEALSCALPVTAYNCKGPKDIIEDKVSGYLVDSAHEMAEAMIEYCRDLDKQIKMQDAALLRSQQLKPEAIMAELLKNAQISDFQDDACRSQ